VAAPIDFYFEFASPYGYLASTRIDTIAARHGRETSWHPIMLGAAFKVTGAQPLAHIPLKGDYMMRDLPRFARLLEVPFKAPPVMPANSLAASRACIWLEQHDSRKAKQLAQAVFHAHWGEGHDIGRPDDVAEIAEPLGIDRSELLAAVADPVIKERLRQATEAAIERGVFGSPFVFVDGEAFWGADRLDQVERWLAAGGW
jgi:2-hydroxychromene-2-carboxylate isomerase